MIESTTTVHVDRSAEEVIAYLADGRNETAWRYDVVASELTRGEAGAAGAVYAQRMKPGRREIEGGLEVLRVEPGERVDWRSTETRPFAFSGSYACRATERGSEVTIHAGLRASGPLRVAEPLMRGTMRKIGRRYADGLKAALESSVPSDRVPMDRREARA